MAERLCHCRSPVVAKRKKKLEQFCTKSKREFERLDVAEIKYAPSMYEPIFEISKKDTATVIVKLSTEVENLSIHYSFDNSFPTSFIRNILRR
jgi:hexosaminidase